MRDRQGEEHLYIGTYPSARLQADYGGVFPVIDELADPLPIADSDLREALIAWGLNFESAYDFRSGWRDKRSLEAHFREAQRLLPLLYREFPGRIVYHDVWEIHYRTC